MAWTRVPASMWGIGDGALDSPGRPGHDVLHGVYGRLSVPPSCALLANTKAMAGTTAIAFFVVAEFVASLRAANGGSHLPPRAYAKYCQGRTFITNWLEVPVNTPLRFAGTARQISAALCE